MSTGRFYNIIYHRTFYKMFNCLSRKDRDLNYKILKPSRKQSRKHLQAHKSELIANQSKKQTLDKSQIKTNRPIFKERPLNRIVSTIEQSPIKLQPIKIQNLEENYISPKNIFKVHRKSRSNFVQLIKQPINLSENQFLTQPNVHNLKHKKNQSGAQGLSTTSFGLPFEEIQADLKRQIIEAVQNLTLAPSFFPKRAQSSLQGLKKPIVEDDTPSINSDNFQNQSNLHLNTNQQFSQCLINKNYKDCQKIFNKLTIDQKNGTDSRGFTPLYLLTLTSIGYPKAFQLLKRVLRDMEVDPNKKVYFGSKPIQQAILFKNIPVLTVLFKTIYLNKISQVKKSLKELALTLSKFPDMHLQLYVKVGSFVPLVDKITPDDTIKIYKRGEHLRIDYSLVGYSFLKCKRRFMSCVLQKLDGQNYTLLALNHDKQSMADLLQPFEDEQLILFIQDLLSTEIKRANPKIESVFIEKQYNIFNKVIRDYINDKVSIKHQLKVSYTSCTQKLKPRSKDAGKDLNFLKSWKDYSVYEPNTKMIKKQKQIKLGVWLSNQFQLSLSQLLEFVKFLSFFHESGNIIYNFLADENIIKNLNGFPVKIQIPMNFSLYLDVKIAHFSLKVPQIQFDYTKKYRKQKRSQFQKTLIRKEKRLSILKFYT